MSLVKTFTAMALAASLAVFPACSSGGGSTIALPGPETPVTPGEPGEPAPSGGVDFAQLASFGAGNPDTVFEVGDVTLDFVNGNVVINDAAGNGVTLTPNTPIDTQLSKAGVALGYSLDGATTLTIDGTATDFATLGVGLDVLEGLDLGGAFKGVDLDSIKEDASRAATQTNGDAEKKLTSAKNEVVNQLKGLAKEFNTQMAALASLFQLGSFKSGEKSAILVYDGTEATGVLADNAKYIMTPAGIAYGKTTISGELLTLVGMEYSSTDRAWGFADASATEGITGIVMAASGYEKNAVAFLTKAKFDAGSATDQEKYAWFDGTVPILSLDATKILSAKLFGDATDGPLNFDLALDKSQAVFGANKLSYLRYGYYANGTEIASTDPEGSTPYALSATDTHAFAVWDKATDSTGDNEHYRLTSSDLQGLLDERDLQMNATFRGNTVAALLINDTAKEKEYAGHLRGTAELRFAYDGGDIDVETLRLQFENWYDVVYDTPSSASLIYKNDSSFEKDLKLIGGTAAWGTGRSVALGDASINDLEFFTNYPDPLAATYAEAGGTYGAKTIEGSFKQEAELKGAFGVSTNNLGIKVKPE